jgi:hypothetical protein
MNIFLKYHRRVRTVAGVDYLRIIKNLQPAEAQSALENSAQGGNRDSNTPWKLAKNQMHFNMFP